MRTSASRPDFLRTSTEALRKYLKYDGGFRWLIHEDVLNDEWSKQCIDYINEVGIYNMSIVDQTPIGQGSSLTFLLEKTESPYILNVEDDYELIKHLDLNPLVELMDTHTEINQIAFFKRRISWKRGNNFIKEQLVINGIPLVTNPHWAFTPALWRASYIKPLWENFNKNIHWRMNDKLKGDISRDSQWVRKNTGTYFLGYGLCCLKEFGGDKTIEEYTNLDNGYYMSHLGMYRYGMKGSVRLGGYQPGQPYWKPPISGSIIDDMWRISK